MPVPGDSPPSPKIVERAAAATTLGPEHWRDVKAIFLDVVACAVADRQSALDALCAGNVALRREVESLLANDAAAGEFLETPARAHLGGTEPTPWVPRLQPGSRIGPYEISEFIAAGGMGEVYRARHTVLRRVVAIKVLASDSGDPNARRRLVREARNAATLAHPNICRIYEVGEEGEQPFIVMEHVDGSSLRELVQKGPPDLRLALRIGLEVADALAHAHQQGIIHCDLKSSNVVVAPNGRAIVLDFGLAKRLASSSDDRSGDSTLTAHGVLAGTLSHMAPEVLLGAPADARSDVWALGVLLYELATGQLPFTGHTSYETSAAIIADPPRPMTTRVPLALRLVIERCLAKDPEARYQRASDVRAALDAIERRRSWPLVGRLLVSTRRRTVRTVVAAVVLAPGVFWGVRRLEGQFGRESRDPVSTIALLPLANATGDSSLAYFADGITDALIARLGALANVRVISRASASRAATSETTPAAIARRLGADMIAQGTLRRGAERVEIDMRLIDPRRGRVLWSDTYDRSTADVLPLQADVARALALAIRLAIRPEAENRLATVRAVRPDAYEEFLKGRYEWNKRTAQSLRRAMAHFSRAVGLDSTYAPAHAALADCYNQLGTVMVGSGSPQQYRPLAEAEAIKALQIDPYSAEAHAALGYAEHYELRWSDAEREFRRAIELNPSDALAHVWYANLLMSRQRFDEALGETAAARALDPFSLIVNTNIGWVLEDAGRHEEAIRQLQQTLALDSNYVQAHMRLAMALASAGRGDDAMAEAKRVVSLMGRTPSSLMILGSIEGRTGRRAEARATLRELLALARTEYVPAWSIASIYGPIGMVDSAMVWVQRAFDERSNAVAYFAVEPLAQTMRGDPRFQRILAQAGLR